MSARSALVVDDSRSARFALRRYLEGHRYQVDAVESADEAMRFLARNKPTVIFLDHVMPGRDGFDVLREIKADARITDVPVVICSSNEGPDFNAQARAVGAHGVLQKPPNPDQLQRILQRLEQSGPLAGMARQPATTSPGTQALAPLSTSSPIHGDAGLANGATGGRDSKASQALVMQFAEIKASVANLASQQTQLAEQPSAMRTELRTGLAELNQSLQLITSRVDALEREVFAQLTAMRTQVDTTLKAQIDRISDLAQFARQAAAEEAQVVAERTVMSAAVRISDQLADAILGAVGRR